jgi:leucine dehydrogenase
MALSSASKRNIKKLHEFDNHVEVFLLKDAKAGLDAVVAFHRKQAGVPSFGATRMMMYDSETEAIRDALRLSRGMSYKAALAGLPCGGAKGVIMFDSRSVKKETILRAYASNIAELNGSFVTGIDVGLQQQDLSTMKQNAKNIIGFNDNSTDFTGRGLCVALECCLKEIFGNKSTKGRSFIRMP